MEELYINNQLVDIGDASISLAFKSNLFSDVSKITSNYSHTIKLPKTHVNDVVFKCADIPTVQTDVVRKYLKARYVVNGIQIIDNGLAVLLNARNGYEVALTWGIIEGYKNMVSESLKLPELEKESDKDNSLLLEQNPNISNYPSGDYFFSEYESGYAGGGVYPKVYPCVKVGFIINKISERYGLIFDFPDNAKDMINKMICPLVTANRYSAKLMKVRLSDVAYAYPPTSPNYGEQVWRNVVQYDANGLIDVFGGAQVNHMGYIANGKCTITGTVKGEDKEYRFELEENEVFKFTDGTPTEEQNNDVRIFTGIAESEENVKVGQYYPIVSNLPDMTCIDFIKEISARCGIFAINSNSDKVLRFISADDFIAKEPEEWHLLEYQEVAFAYSDFARNNMYKYLTDEFCDWEADGTIVVNNETLDEKKDVFSSKFASAKGNNIPLFTTEKKDNQTEVKLNKLKPRIGFEINNNGKSKFSFVGMEFSTLVERNMKEYQRIVSAPTVIKGTVKLNEWELKNIDYSVPVYIRTLGRRYAIISIGRGNNGIYEVELIQL